MIDEMKLSKKDLQECLNNLEGEKFLDAFCVIDWVNKTEKENQDLQQRIDKAIELIDNIYFGSFFSDIKPIKLSDSKEGKELLSILKGKEVK